MFLPKTGKKASISALTTSIPHCIFLNYFTEVQLIYNIVLTSAIQQSESVTHNTHTHTHTHILFHIFFHYIFLPGESQGQRRLVGCRLFGHTESDTTEVTSQQQQQFIIGYWIQFAVLYSRSLLFIHSLYNSLHLTLYCFYLQMTRSCQSNSMKARIIFSKSSWNSCISIWEKHQPQPQTDPQTPHHSNPNARRLFGRNR